ncbi:inorganic diphosphatase [Candidatus Nitrososphaera sp. FF02]|uniref:inorganic diphosphatase n=1 Tax=Candidatus Nitrososphaera sp. FF02 TaxID=3398226 RepID=UPI0039E91850
MALVDSLKAGKNPPEEINVVIEIPKGSNIKYEIDDETGALFVDRKLFTAMFYPCNYGFVPQTKEKDGDPVDVLVLGNDPVVPMSVIRATPVGVLITADEEGEDAKVVAVPVAKIDPTFSGVKDIQDVPQHIQDQIKHFFEHYKELEKNKYVKVKGWENKETAKKKISEAMESYRKE